MADIKFSCCHCAQSLAAPSDMAGELIDCPTCNKPVEIPFPPRTAVTEQMRPVAANIPTSNASDDSGDSNVPLMWAYAGDMDFTVPFLKSFGSALYVNSHGVTLLHAAVEGWQYRMVEFLIAYGSDPNVQDKDGDTPLHALTRSRIIPAEGTFIKDANPDDARTQTFRTLLQHGAQRGIKNSQGATALHLAALDGDLLAINEITLGASPDMIDDVTAKGATALAIAVVKNHVECARRLLLLGASVVCELSSSGSLVDVMRSSDNPEMQALANTVAQR